MLKMATVQFLKTKRLKQSSTKNGHQVMSRFVFAVPFWGDNTQMLHENLKLQVEA